MALPQVKIPAGAKQVSISFVVGQLDGSSCAFYLWDAAGKSTTDIGKSRNSRDTFVIAGAPDTLRGRIVEWDFSLFSYTGGTNERYAVTVILIADGEVIGTVPETGIFTKQIDITDGVQLA